MSRHISSVNLKLNPKKTDDSSKHTSGAVKSFAGYDREE